MTTPSLPASSGSSRVTTPVYFGRGVVTPDSSINTSDAPSGAGVRKIQTSDSSGVEKVPVSSSSLVCASADVFKAMLELTRWGARWTEEDGKAITRPKMRAAVKDSHQSWKYMSEPPTLQVCRWETEAGARAFCYEARGNVTTQLSNVLSVPLPSPFLLANITVARVVL